MVGQSLSVLYEDEALLVVDKPAGIHTAPLSIDEPDTLLSAVLAAFPEVSSVPGIKPAEPGLLHRLDRETSGTVVIGRTTAAFSSLRRQFNRGEVRKEYRAVCACPAENVEKTPGERLDPARHISIESRFAPAGPGRRLVRVVLRDEKGRKSLKEATGGVYLTEATVGKVENGRALMEIVILRGFRHQVRAHLSHLGWPIFGDALYGVPAPPGVPRRMYLHALAVSLKHPVTGETMRVESPLPAEFHLIMAAPADR